MLSRLSIILLLFFTASCNGFEFPRDPEGTLKKVSGNILKAGYTEEPPNIVEGADGPSGFQVEMVEKFANSIDSRVQWIKKSEQKLFEDLENYEIDIVIGGFSKETPWKDRVGISRPIKDLKGNEFIFAVSNGENAFLVKLERFLHDNFENSK